MLKILKIYFHSFVCAAFLRQLNNDNAWHITHLTAIKKNLSKILSVSRIHTCKCLFVQFTPLGSERACAPLQVCAPLSVELSDIGRKLTFYLSTFFTFFTYLTFHSKRRMIGLAWGFCGSAYVSYSCLTYFTINILKSFLFELGLNRIHCIFFVN